MKFLRSCGVLPLIVIALCSRSVNGCGRGSIVISNNGYKNILIAVDENVQENPTLIERIKSVFTQASVLLYQVTKNRAYFEEIKILVPKKWNGSYARAGKESFDKSDIVVGLPETRINSGNQPFVIKTTPCGEFGHYMHLTQDYILDDSVGKQYGAYDKLLVHEWAHLRYGVYDEYQTDTNGNYFYAAANGQPEAIRCSSSIPGSQYNPSTGNNQCGSEGTLPDKECRFKINIPAGETGYASLMYSVDVDQITGFCDNDPNNPKELHNRETTTSQNRFCGRRSVWEVLREHEDFSNGNNPARTIADPTPTFNVMQQKAPRTVLVLDVSGSMTGAYIKTLGQGCTIYITNIIQDGEYLGIVWFNKIGYQIADLQVIDNVSRTDMLQYIPRLARGGTSIGGGVIEALKMLKAHDPNFIGGNIVVVSDGMENAQPYIADVIQNVTDCQVTAHTIAISENADSNLENLATITGGLSFIYSGKSNSNAMNDAFLAIGEVNLDPTAKSYVLSSVATSLSGTTLSNTVLIDNTLGTETQFIFDYSTGTIDPFVMSPTGKVFYKNDTSIVKNDATFGVYTFTIPKVDFQSGSWNYTIPAVNTNPMVSVTVKSKSAIPGTYPIIASVQWGKRNIVSIGPGANNPKQQIYASVSQGYTPVLNAVVVATVERIKKGDSVDVPLLDNGAGADARKGDGIYSAYFLQFDNKGRYGLTVKVDSTPTTVISPQTLIGYAATTPTTTSSTSDTPVDPFTRTTIGGTFSLANFTDPGPSGKFYLPGQIQDLRVVSSSYDNQTVTLTWTAVGDQLDSGQASSYDLRMGTNFSDMESSFSTQTMVTNTMVVSGGNLTSPLPAGQTETFIIKVPTRGTVTYVFAVKAVDTDGRNEQGPQSNIASASLKLFVTVSPTSPLSTTIMIILSVGAAVLLVVIIVTTVLVCAKSTSPPKIPGPSLQMTANLTKQGPYQPYPVITSYNNGAYMYQVNGNIMQDNKIRPQRALYNGKDREYQYI